MKKITHPGLVAALAGSELLLKATAWHFLYHLPPSRIRGRKGAWLAATFVNTFGPLAFLIWGIRR